MKRLLQFLLKFEAVILKMIFHGILRIKDSDGVGVLESWSYFEEANWGLRNGTPTEAKEQALES